MPRNGVVNVPIQIFSADWKWAALLLPEMFGWIMSYDGARAPHEFSMDGIIHDEVHPVHYV
jgi:hypothetical protein